MTAVGALAGAFSFGVLHAPTPLYAALVYVTLAAIVAMPVMGIATLAVRHLFLREARRHGLSLSASLLVMTRAERRARFLSPFRSVESETRLLVDAVRDWDRA
jgi:hypothetical protein